ncbi:sporulation protein [Neobacillus sp. PS3-40]|uniref:sporulation protein n=1 Tax=Neobacillus sp. PS3-40 TaxID=3070679 RepID=UPI0027E0437A|nr:sporulation protein [Neobacillus sp. PS3-40]WML43403.1 sporulation protein [Neobacillus sp. PS3-40]
MRKKYGLLMFCCLGILATGCEHSEQKDVSKLAIVKTINPSAVAIDKNQPGGNDVEQVKEDISSLPELYDVAVIKGKKDILVAYKVKHLHRFKMKAIEKKMNKMLEKKYPKENFTVSSDYKIFLEAVKLNERIKSKNYSDKKAETRLKQIIKMTNEMT